MFIILRSDKSIFFYYKQGKENLLLRSFFEFNQDVYL